MQSSEVNPSNGCEHCHINTITTSFIQSSDSNLMIFAFQHLPKIEMTNEMIFNDIIKNHDLSTMHLIRKFNIHDIKSTLHKCFPFKTNFDLLRYMKLIKLFDIDSTKDHFFESDQVLTSKLIDENLIKYISWNRFNDFDPKSCSSSIQGQIKSEGLKSASSLQYSTDKYVLDPCAPPFIFYDKNPEDYISSFIHFSKSFLDSINVVEKNGRFIKGISKTSDTDENPDSSDKLKQKLEDNPIILELKAQIDDQNATINNLEVLTQMGIQNLANQCYPMIQQLKSDVESINRTTYFYVSLILILIAMVIIMF